MEKGEDMVMVMCSRQALDVSTAGSRWFVVIAGLLCKADEGGGIWRRVKRLSKMVFH